MTDQLCLICEEGHIHSQIEQVKVEHLGQTGLIESHYSICDMCGSEQATTADARFNKRAMIAFKKQVQDLLTGDQVRKLRKQWGLNQEQAAKVFGGGPVAFSKYETDDVMQAESMDKLIRLASAIPAAFNKLVEDAGIGFKNQVQLHEQPDLYHEQAFQNQLFGSNSGVMSKHYRKTLEITGILAYSATDLSTTINKIVSSSIETASPKEWHTVFVVQDSQRHNRSRQHVVSERDFALEERHYVH